MFGVQYFFEIQEIVHEIQGFFTDLKLKKINIYGYTSFQIFLSKFYQNVLFCWIVVNSIEAGSNSSLFIFFLKWVEFDIG